MNVRSYNASMNLIFAWDDWNLAHIARHGIGPDDAEYVVRHVSPPWPDEKGDDKLLVWGATAAGDLLQPTLFWPSTRRLLPIGRPSRVKRMRRPGSDRGKAAEWVHDEKPISRLCLEGSGAAVALDRLG